MAIASGIICGWPSTNASIPAGWSRETTLDAVFVKGVATAATNPNTTGGAATHSHATGATHTHTTTHSHTMSGSVGNNSGVSARATGAQAKGAGASHAHTNPASVASTAAGTSGTAQPNSDTANNDPINLVVIWIKSDGSPTGFPNSSLVFFNSDTLPTSWSRYANSQNRHFKGAAAAGDGGGTNAGNSSHTHATATHSHSVPSHTHAASGTTGASPNSIGQNTANVSAGTNHTHTVSADAATGTTGTTIQSETASGSGSSEPPYYKLNCISNGTGGADIPEFSIAGWLGTIATIPTNWTICDGNNGTPNTLGKYLKGCNADGELGNTGGSATHTHTDPGTHTHPEGTDVHTTTVSAESASVSINAGATNLSTSAHTHTGTNTDASTDSTGTGTAGTYDTPNSEPSYVTVAWLQWQPNGPPVTTVLKDIIGGLGVIPFAR